MILFTAVINKGDQQIADQLVKDKTEAEFMAKHHKQQRVIRRYAKAKKLRLEVAYNQWCEFGLDEKWGKFIEEGKG